MPSFWPLRVLEGECECLDDLSKGNHRCMTLRSLLDFPLYNRPSWKKTGFLALPRGSFPPECNIS